MRGGLLIVLIAAFGCRAPTPPSSDDHVYEPRDGGGRGPRVIVSGSNDPPATGSDPTFEGGCGARLLVIFDRSGSMNEDWPASGAPRYQVAAEALTDAITPLADRLIVGAIAFPSASATDPDLCAVVDPIESQLPFTAGSSFLAQWDARWRSIGADGSTPLDTAFQRADQALAAVDDVTAMVVLTDGQPTCAETVSAAARAARWLSRGIKTYVVGLPGVDDAGGFDPPDVLDLVAQQGGTDAYLPVDDPSVLEAHLASIAGDAISQSCAP